MDGCDRRDFIVKATGAVLAAGAVSGMAAGAYAQTMYDTGVDAKLFDGINRVKDPSKMTGLELHHAPDIKVPTAVKAGEPFVVEVQAGRELHSTSVAHRIYSIQLLAGNEPIGAAVFESIMANPRASFLVTLDRPVTLVAVSRCNLHGLWEGSVDIKM